MVWRQQFRSDVCLPGWTCWNRYSIRERDSFWLVWSKTDVRLDGSYEGISTGGDKFIGEVLTIPTSGTE